MQNIHGRLVADPTEEIQLNKFEKYVRTDRNGTRYFTDCRCNRCGGQGLVFSKLDNGICWGCGGSGYGNAHEFKVYTPEYAEKLQKKEDERHAKKIEELKKGADEANQKFFQFHGYNENGKTYVVLGKTFEIKDELKELGAKWDNVIGWHFANDTDKYPTVEIDVEDSFFKDICGRFSSRGSDHWKPIWYEGADEYEGDYDENGNFVERKIDWETATRKIADANAKLNAVNATSEYVGEVGKRMKNIKLTFKGSRTWETHFTYYGETQYLHKFEDENGNALVWKTSNPLDKIVDDKYVRINEDEEITVAATVKEHSEYDGIKQTVLTRVKIA